MKFAYFCNVTNWTHKPYSQLLDEVRDIAVHCDAADGTRSGSPSTTSTTKAWMPVPTR